MDAFKPQRLNFFNFYLFLFQCFIRSIYPKKDLHKTNKVKINEKFNENEN